MNVNAAQRLLRAAAGASLRAARVRFHLVGLWRCRGPPTSEELVPRPVSPYGVTKVAAEHLARIYWRVFGVPAVCLRYFTVYGPRQRPDMAFNRLIACALSGEPFEVFGDGNQTRDFTFVGDAVNGTVAAARYGVPGAVYNIGGGSQRSLNSVFETLSELLAGPLELKYCHQQLGDARDAGRHPPRATRSGL